MRRAGRCRSSHPVPTLEKGPCTSADRSGAPSPARSPGHDNRSAAAVDHPRKSASRPCSFSALGCSTRTSEEECPGLSPRSPWGRFCPWAGSSSPGPHHDPPPLGERPETSATPISSPRRCRLACDIVCPVTMAWGLLGRRGFGIEAAFEASGALRWASWRGIWLVRSRNPGRQYPHPRAFDSGLCAPFEHKVVGSNPTRPTSGNSRNPHLSGRFRSPDTTMRQAAK